MKYTIIMVMNCITFGQLVGMEQEQWREIIPQQESNVAMQENGPISSQELLAKARHIVTTYGSNNGYTIKDRSENGLEIDLVSIYAIESKARKGTLFWIPEADDEKTLSIINDILLENPSKDVVYDFLKEAYKQKKSGALNVERKIVFDITHFTSQYKLKPSLLHGKIEIKFDKQPKDESTSSPVSPRRTWSPKKVWDSLRKKQ